MATTSARWKPCSPATLHWPDPDMNAKRCKAIRKLVRQAAGGLPEKAYRAVTHNNGRETVILDPASQRGQVRAIKKQVREAYRAKHSKPTARQRAVLPRSA